jgi:VanZ family protein
MTTAEDEQFLLSAPSPVEPGDGSVAVSPAARRGGVSTAGRLLRSWGPAVAWMAVIFALSAQPGLRISDDPGVDGPFRHFAHVVAYAALAMLLVRGLSGEVRYPWTWRLIVAAVAIATLYGVSDEIHQTYVPLRTGHLIDVGWDLIGATVGVAALRVVANRWPRLASVVTGMH